MGGPREYPLLSHPDLIQEQPHAAHRSGPALCDCVCAGGRPWPVCFPSLERLRAACGGLGSDALGLGPLVPLLWRRDSRAHPPALARCWCPLFAGILPLGPVSGARLQRLVILTLDTAAATGTTISDVGIGRRGLLRRHSRGRGWRDAIGAQLTGNVWGPVGGSPIEAQACKSSVCQLRVLLSHTLDAARSY